MIKPPKSEAGRREVVLLDALAAVLPVGGNGYIFGGAEPWSKSQVSEKWLEWCKAVGLAHESVTVEVDPKTKKKKTRRRWSADITAHQLRHAFATMLYDAGIDEMDTKRLDGTQLYSGYAEHLHPYSAEPEGEDGGETERVFGSKFCRSWRRHWGVRGNICFGRKPEENTRGKPLDPGFS